MSNQKSSIKSGLFLNSNHKDEVKKIRNKDDFELSIEARSNLPKYSSEVVLNSFLERQEKTNKRFFARTWERMKRNIIGQTMWILIIYLFFYYLIHILLVQQTINTSSWFSRKPLRDGVLTDPLCETDFCNCCNSVNLSTTDFNGDCEDLRTPVFKFHPMIDRCIEAKNIGRLVESYEKKQSRLLPKLRNKRVI